MEKDNIKLELDLELLKTRITALEGVFLSNSERQDAIFQNIGEIGGILDDDLSYLSEIEEKSSNLEKISFDKYEFFSKLGKLSDDMDSIFSRIDGVHPLVEKLMGDMESFMKESRFVDLFGDTNSLFRESKELSERIALQLNEFRVSDFETQYRNFNNLVSDVDKYKLRIDALNKRFVDINKRLSFMDAHASSTINSVDFFTKRKELILKISDIRKNLFMMSQKMIEVKSLPAPNVLFLGQSLHLYVSKMIEIGYRSDYIFDKLSRQGVDREYLKVVIDRLTFGLK